MDLKEFNKKFFETENSVAPLASGTCKVTIINNAPQAWGAVVTIVGAVFFYADGTNWSENGIGVYLAYGQSTTLYSNDPSNCVAGVQSFVQVNFPDGSSTVLQGTANRPSQSQCLTEDTVTVKASGSVPVVEFESLKYADLVVLE